MEYGYRYYHIFKYLSGKRLGRDIKNIKLNLTIEL